MPMVKLEVGKVYSPLLQAPKTGIVTYNYTAGGHLLTLTVPRPRPGEVNAARGGKISFAFVPYKHVLFFLFKLQGFADNHWTDAPFSFYLNPADRQQAPPAQLPTPETRDTLQIIFADSETAVVKALRFVSFSPEFTRSLWDAIREAAQEEVAPQTYDAEIAEAYAMFPDSDAMHAAATAECEGGV